MQKVLFSVTNVTTSSFFSDYPGREPSGMSPQAPGLFSKNRAQLFSPPLSISLIARRQATCATVRLPSRGLWNRSALRADCRREFLQHRSMDLLRS